MSGEIARLWAKIGADVKDFVKGTAQVKRGLKQTEADVKKSKASFKGLNDTIKIVGATMVAMGVMKAGKYALELDKLGRESLRLKDSFQELARQHQMSSRDIMASLKAASGATVSEMDLMLGANRAMKFGIVETEEEFRNLMLAARFYGRQMGVDTTEAYDRMVTGIGRGSIQILDDLGIVGLSFDKNTSKAEIMSQVVTQAMSEIAAAGGIMEDAADKTAKLSAKMADFKQLWAEIVAKSGVVDFGVDIAIEGLTGWNQFITDWKILQENDVIPVKVLLEVAGLGGVATAGDWVKDAWTEAQAQLGIIDRYTAGARKTGGLSGGGGGFGGGLAAEIDDVGAAMRRLPTDEAVPGWLTTGTDALFGMAEANSELRAVEQALQDERADEAKKYWTEFTARGEQAWSTISGFVDQAFTSYEDFIRINLQGTTADVGDAWDEMARRAEAVANDMESKGTSPWLSMFQIPQDVLERGGDTLKAYMQKLAKDIRESPTVQELGQVGIDALVKNAKKSIFDRLGKQELNLTVGQQLLKDPETVAALGTLGMDVTAALATGTDRTNAMLETLNMTIPTEIRAQALTANTIAGDIRANSAMQYNAMAKMSDDWPGPLQTETSRIVTAISDGLAKVLDVRVVDGSITIAAADAQGMGAASMLSQIAALS